MRSPANFRRVREDIEGSSSHTAESACSADAVFWEIGLVLAVFLGLALSMNAACIAFGAN